MRPDAAVLAFADSEVSVVDTVGDALRVRFAAARISRRTTRPGVDEGTDVFQPLELILGSARWTGAVADCIGLLEGGHVHVGDRDVGPPPVPATLAGAVRLELRFMNGAMLAATGTTLAIAAPGDVRASDDFRC